MLSKPEAVIVALENAPAIVVPLVREVPAEILKRRPQPGKWSAHEHACHLAEVHALFFSRLELMLNESHPRIKMYDPDEAMEEGALLKVLGRPRPSGRALEGFDGRRLAAHCRA
jgi:hypothetical protein